MQMNIKLHYCSGIKNFGDELSPYIIKKITGKRVEFVDRTFEGGGVYAIGSLIDYESIRKNGIILGSGMLSRDSLNMLPHPFPVNRFVRTLKRRIGSIKDIKVDIRSVRGPLTRGALMKAGVDCPQIYGDPAILLPEIYKPNTNDNGKLYQCGLIFHHTQIEEVRRITSVCEKNGIKIININREGDNQIEEFIDEVCSCEKIYSSSLHGLIVAQAYGIPAQWVKIKNNKIHRDADFKFIDYFSGVHILDMDPLSTDLNEYELRNMKSKKLHVNRPSDKSIRDVMNVFEKFSKEI